MSVLISVPIARAISQYSNLNHACADAKVVHESTTYMMNINCISKANRFKGEQTI